MRYSVGQSVLFVLRKEEAEEWNRRPENDRLPGDIFVPSQEGEMYPAIVIAVRGENAYLKVWPIGGGALNVVVPAGKD